MRDNFVLLNIGNSLKIFLSLLRGVHMGVYSDGLIIGRNFALESGWAYIRVGVYTGGLIFRRLRYSNQVVYIR